jgi:hypothetical protein
VQTEIYERGAEERWGGTARRVGIIAHLVGRASENNVENCFAVFLSRFQGHTGVGARGPLTGALSVFHQSRGPFHHADIEPARFCVRCIPLDCNRGELLNLLHLVRPD